MNLRWFRASRCFGWGLRGEFGGFYRTIDGIVLRTDGNSNHISIEDNNGHNRRNVLDTENGVRKAGDYMTGALLLSQTEPSLENEAMSKQWTDKAIANASFLPLTGGSVTGRTSFFGATASVTMEIAGGQRGFASLTVVENCLCAEKHISYPVSRNSVRSEVHDRLR